MYDDLKKIKNNTYFFTWR